MSRFLCSSSRTIFLWALLAPACELPLAAQQIVLEEVTVSDYEGGFGVPLTYEFSPGQTVHLAFRIGGFKTEERAESRRRQAGLTYTLRAVDCSGRLLAPPQTSQIDKLLTERERNWAPVIRYSVQLPGTPRAGTHNFRVWVRDTIGGSSAALEIPFEVQSPFDEPDPNLNINRFLFYESEPAGTPIDGVPVFRPGAALWGRFYLTGFRTDEDNGYNLSYGVSVRNPAGRVLLNEPKAAAESKPSFYPKTHVPGMISVMLGRTIRPGSYFLVLSAIDTIGNQQVKAEFPFRVSD